MSQFQKKRVEPRLLRGEARPTEWIVNNFKSLQHASLPLRHLTVLTGANSSGKSSVIQSLLLLAQSPDEKVVLNGALARLGNPQDIIRSGASRVELGYSVESRESETGTRSEWSFMLELGATSQGLQIVSFDAAVDGNPVISATSSRISSATEAEVNPDCRHGHRLLRVSEIRGRKAPPRTYVTFNGFSPEALIVRIKKDKLLAALRRKFGKRAIREGSEHLFELYGVLQPWWRDHRNNLPHEVVELYGELFQRGPSLQSFRKSAEEGGLDKLLESYVEESDDWRHLQVRGYPGLRSRQYFPESAYFGLGEEFKMALKDLVIAKEGLRTIRESVRYLGPLREDPQVVSRSGELNRSLPAGVKGEYAADLLSREKDRVIEFRDWDQRHLKSKLSEAVSLWTSYLQVGDRVAVEDHGKLGRGLRIRVHGVDRDLTTVGVGASQLLPVVMMVLAATPGSTICIEQPELHLHPAVQSRLADFFLYARPDVALVIETHSEYMITRIRRRVAEGFASIDRVAIMFAEQRNGVTSFRLLQISEDGDLSDWPDGFFDAQDEDARALVRAIAQRVAFS